MFLHEYYLIFLGGKQIFDFCVFKKHLKKNNNNRSLELEENVSVLVFNSYCFKFVVEIK